MPTLGLFIYRSLSIPTFKSVLELQGSVNGWEWDVEVETGDALISRARSTLASKWLRESQQDVLVMADDDFYFTPQGLEALVLLCRQKRAIVAGVTPLRSGEYTAIVPLDLTSAETPWDSREAAPQRVLRAGGLLAYPRAVFEALTHTLPLLHRGDRIPAFWPFFAPAFQQEGGIDVYLSEEYACQERARQAGFQVWVQPACQVGHAAEILVSSGNMAQVREIFGDPTLGGTFPHGG